LATLRQLYGTMTVSDLSARIGRPKKSIYAKAWELRLKSSIRGVPPLRREVVEQIEEMNRDGMNDVQISAHLRAMGIMVSAVIVGKYRRLAGLPSHQFNPERKAKIAAALALVMQGEDMRRKVAENAITARRAILETRQDFARRSGWPEGLTTAGRRDPQFHGPRRAADGPEGDREGDGGELPQRRYRASSPGDSWQRSGPSTGAAGRGPCSPSARPP
jgi:hypothetical protein